MGKSNGRDIYLQRAKNLPTAHEFVEAMEKSPFAVHRRVAPELRRMVDVMSAVEMEKLKKQAASQEFEKLIMTK